MSGFGKGVAPQATRKPIKLDRMTASTTSHTHNSGEQQFRLRFPGLPKFVPIFLA